VFAPGLSVDQQQVISTASRAGITETLQQLKRYFLRGRWLGSNNRYRNKTISNLVVDRRSDSIETKHLAEYIAASALLHSADGWSFLARALSSHLAGDASQSLHLAYYAELRAAMSLLASEGVGIFNDTHFVVTATGACQVIPRPTKRTHVITWEVLEYWASTSAAFELFGKVLWPAGRSLADWISAFPGGSGAGLIGADFLRTWGIDICNFSRDRDSRNEVSYRPSQIGSPLHQTTWNSAKFVLGFWEAFEPSYIRETQVDRFLLRSLLEKTHKSITGAKNQRDFMRRVGITLDSLGIIDASRNEWTGFFSRVSLPQDPQVMSIAATGAKGKGAERHLQVISRAALLLRVASGSCRGLLEESLISKTDLQFWWNPLGEERGLWAAAAAPEDFFDLWADIEDSLTKLNKWTNDHVPSECNLYDLLSTGALDLSRLSSCELVGLWSTTP
jgi:hypothetical protein